VLALVVLGGSPRNQIQRSALYFGVLRPAADTPKSPAAEKPSTTPPTPHPPAFKKQYENFTGPAAAAGPLSDLQLFLGLDPSLAPRELPREHARRDAHPEGWPIKKGELERLLALIRPEAERLGPARAALDCFFICGARRAVCCRLGPRKARVQLSSGLAAAANTAPSRPPLNSTAAELERRGYTRAEHWLAPWRRIWKAALATCSPGGDCRVVL
jgi:hypothetical protein